jgi:hypothetical protein
MTDNDAKKRRRPRDPNQLAKLITDIEKKLRNCLKE